MEHKGKVEKHTELDERLLDKERNENGMEGIKPGWSATGRAHRAVAQSCAFRDPTPTP